MVKLPFSQPKQSQSVFYLFPSFLRFFMLAFVVTIPLMAQPVQVVVELDTTAGTLGDVFQASWRIQHSVGSEVLFPTLEERIATFEVLEQERISAPKNVTTWQLSVAVYDSVGPHDFPDLTGAVISGTDTSSIKLPGFRVAIHSVLTAADSTFHPIKPIHPVRLPFNWWIVAYAVLAVVVIYLLYRFWPRHRTRTRQKRTDIVIIPPEEAHIVALRELKALKSAGHLEQGAFKVYYSKLTTILRRYFENRFLINALEMTTSEVLKALKDDILKPREWRDTQIILGQGDLVKFAKHIPISSEAENALKMAVELVEGTKIQLETTRQKSDLTQQAEVEDKS